MNRTGFPGGPNVWKDGAMTTNRTTKPYPAQLRERTVRLVRGHEAGHASLAAAIRAVAAKVGCHAETLRLWVCQAGRDAGREVVAARDRRTHRSTRLHQYASS